nr:immunoglobulin light chain junction region [Macaca mulatta]MPN95021.1 immunoglobulin light chain junction region [Macaca mulatta]MPN95645.1 immunoglobulin light chain junction region [Macaca mulatta]MPN96008.1 immunoglobulin light chain junction region [Macaca mulatta]MPN96362.1 immunoglobulin light chain junction region [Macaca mulatta]
CVQAIAFPPSF